VIRGRRKGASPGIIQGQASASAEQADLYGFTERASRSALGPQIRCFLLERVWFYPIRLMNWFKSK
jgi:hypothetical protein